MFLQPKKIERARILLRRQRMSLDEMDDDDTALARVQNNIRRLKLACADTWSGVFGMSKMKGDVYENRG